MLIEKKLQKKHCVNTSLLTYYTLPTKIPFKELDSITCSENFPKNPIQHLGYQLNAHQYKIKTKLGSIRFVPKVRANLILIQ